jgi:hypothetical protein
VCVAVAELEMNQRQMDPVSTLAQSLSTALGVTGQNKWETHCLSPQFLVYVWINDPLVKRAFVINVSL